MVQSPRRGDAAQRQGGHIERAVGGFRSKILNISSNKKSPLFKSRDFFRYAPEGLYYKTRGQIIAVRMPANTSERLLTASAVWLISAALEVPITWAEVPKATP